MITEKEQTQNDEKINYTSELHIFENSEEGY
jgi:hypothetical protein